MSPSTPPRRIGPYEVVAVLGSGGMGEVLRARDSRLGREVALKVLPVDWVSDSERLRRFEREARAASALSHPNIVAIYDIGSGDSQPYIAMELVEGRTLREVLRTGPLPAARILEIGAAIAEGLARAHEEGIVHRDVKPENVMVGRDGVVKILDFGLAKRTFDSGASGGGDTETFVTEPGTVAGTVRYMSPEQASGRALDFRSDQFSLGSVLYEMIAGLPAFSGETNVDTLAAILHAEPGPLASVQPATPPPLRWIVDRCLAKDPADRYASTRDLVRDLRAVAERSSEVGALPPRRVGKPVRPWAWAALGAGTATLVVLGAWLAFRGLSAASPPTLRQLTFRSGVVWSAHFAPDEATVLYAASWEGRPLEVFIQRVDSPESRPLGIPGGIFGVSGSGEMALCLREHGAQAWIDAGTLARMGMTSSTAPREVLEDVQWAAWAPDGRDFAIVRDVGGHSTLEYPIGTTLHRAPNGFLSHPSVSRDGSRVAFLDHPVRGDDAGSVAVVDRRGRATTLVSGLSSVYGAAWSPGGDEVWFTGTENGANRALQAVTLRGRRRPLAQVFGSMQLDAVSPSGKTLLTHDQRKQHVFSLARGDTRERELSWLDYSLARAISRDGKRVLFVEGGEGAGSRYGVFVRGIDGSPPIRLGDGDAQALSGDGTHALAILRQTRENSLVVYSVGAGQPHRLSTGGLEIQRADFLPDDSRILVTGSLPGRPSRIYALDASEGAPRPLTPEGYGAVSGTISPDGKRVVAIHDGKLEIVPLDGSPRFPLESSEPVEPCGWTEDGLRLFVLLRSRVVPQAAVVPPGPLDVGILDVKTGRIEPWKRIGGEDGASSVRITPSGEAYVYSFVHTQGDLYLIDGLK